MRAPRATRSDEPCMMTRCGTQLSHQVIWPGRLHVIGKIPLVVRKRRSSINIVVWGKKVRRGRFGPPFVFCRQRAETIVVWHGARGLETASGEQRFSNRRQFNVHIADSFISTCN